MTSSSNDGALARRIRALLAKADATEFPEEAEAFLAKAQELLARHALDEASLHQWAEADEVVSRNVLVPGPYSSARSQLLCAVVRHNGCRVLHGPSTASGQHCCVFGYPWDLDLSLALYDQVAVQAARALAQASYDGDRPRRFRHAFLLAYAARIDERLGSATAEARDSAGTGRAELELVLRDRRDAVDRAIAARYPRLGTRRVTATSGAGYASGRAAADRAALGGEAIGRRRELPRGDR